MRTLTPMRTPTCMHKGTSLYTSTCMFIASNAFFRKAEMDEERAAHKLVAAQLATDKEWLQKSNDESQQKLTKLEAGAPNML